MEKKKINYLAKMVSMVFIMCLLMGTFVKASDLEPKLSDKNVITTVSDQKTIHMVNLADDNSKVKWSVNKKKMATIEVTGNKNQFVTIIPQKSGTVVIKATYKNKTYKCKVKIKKTGISFQKKTVSITDKFEIGITEKESMVNPDEIKWKISNEEILKEIPEQEVGKKTFKAVKEGKAVITAVYKGKKYKTTIKVKKPSLDRKKIKMALSDVQTLQFENPTSEIKWGVSNPDFVKIEKSGDFNEKVTLIPKMKGSAMVWAKMNGKKYVCRVHVIETEINKETTDLNLELGQTEDVKLSFVSSDVTWNVSDKNVVTITTSGKYNRDCTIKAVGYGKATVTASYKGHAYIINVTIENKQPRVVDAHVHEWDDGHEVIKADCEKGGLICYSCKTCSSVKNEYTEPLGHVISDEYVTEKEATCGEDGILVKRCKRCDKKMEEKAVLKTGQHEYEKVGTYTCGKQNVLYVCKNCNSKKYEEELIPHEYTEEKTVDVEPTCVSKGSKSKKCRYCGEKSEIEEMEALGHDFIIENDATCTQGGYETTTCSRCDYYKYIAVPSLKHHPINGYCENCKKYEAGLYSDKGELLVTWDNLLLMGLDLSKNYRETETRSSASHINQIIEKYSLENGMEGKSFNLCVSDKVVTIGAYALADISRINIITVEKGITGIGAYAFKGSKMTQVKGLGGVTSYGSFAFKDCSKLEMITLSPNVYNFGNGIFENCTSLKIASLPSDLKYISEDTYKNCKSLTDLIIPEGVEGIGAGAFYNCESLANITIPTTIKTIGEQAFYNCKKITELNFNDNITDIKKYTFYGCEKLEKITVGKNVEQIGDYAFYGCGSLNELDLSNKTSSIGSYAFAKSGIKTILLADGLQTLSAHIFEDCTKLASVQLPNTVKNVESYAFNGCISLKMATLSDKLIQLEEGAFFNCKSLESMTVPDSIKLMGNNIWKGCLALSQISYDGKDFTNNKELNQYVMDKNVATSDVWVK